LSEGSKFRSEIKAKAHEVIITLYDLFLPQSERQCETIEEEAFTRDAIAKYCNLSGDWMHHGRDSMVRVFLYIGPGY